MTNKCFVYWIRMPGHSDIYSEGYIGISYDPVNRLTQHLRWARVDSRPYHHDFKRAMISGNYVIDVLVCGTREYCMDLEFRLRPDTYIGWNIAIGGGGGAYSHGLTNSKSYKTLRNLRYRARLSGIKLCEEWSGEGAAVNFDSFYNDKIKDTNLEVYTAHLSTEDVVSPDTVILATRAEIADLISVKYDVLNDGIHRSITDLGKTLGIIPNTIVCRLRRGYDIFQACELSPPPKKIVCFDGMQFEYYGGLSQESLLQFKVDYEMGGKMTELSAKYNLDSSQLSRLSRRFKFARPTVEGFCGSEFVVGANSKLSADDYRNIKKMCLEGVSCIEMSKLFMVSIGTIYSAVNKLKWKEFTCDRTLG